VVVSQFKIGARQKPSGLLSELVRWAVHFSFAQSGSNVHCTFALLRLFCRHCLEISKVGGKKS